VLRCSAQLLQNVSENTQSHPKSRMVLNFWMELDVIRFRSFWLITKLNIKLPEDFVSYTQINCNRKTKLKVRKVGTKQSNSYDDCNYVLGYSLKIRTCYLLRKSCVIMQRNRTKRNQMQATKFKVVEKLKLSCYRK
jgi:hypothetical protein